MKKCSKCKELKETSLFSKQKDKKDGFCSQCKVCSSKRVKKYRHENYGKYLENKRLGYLKHREKRLESSKKYNKENRDKQRIRQSNRLKNDPEFKITRNLRGRLYKAIKGIIKTSSSIDLLGCSITDFKSYIESQFKVGMTWENYNLYSWHIDHIRPCCTFDLNDPDQQRQCFHYSNLQPLWAEENLRKKKRF